MGGPLTGVQLPAGVREFREKLQAWHLAASAWVGLDPTKVSRIELVEDSEIPECYVMVKWESTQELTAKFGSQGPMSLASGCMHDDEPVLRCLQATQLDFREGRALYAEVGPMPEMFSAAEKAALEQRFGVRS